MLTKIITASAKIKVIKDKDVPRTADKCPKCKITGIITQEGVKCPNCSKLIRKIGKA